MTTRWTAWVSDEGYVMYKGAYFEFDESTQDYTKEAGFLQILAPKSGLSWGDVADVHAATMEVYEALAGDDPDISTTVWKDGDEWFRPCFVYDLCVRDTEEASSGAVASRLLLDFFQLREDPHSGVVFLLPEYLAPKLGEIGVHRVRKTGYWAWRGLFREQVFNGAVVIPAAFRMDKAEEAAANA